jgi:uncharacterized protein (TIGR02246 family)
MSSVDNQAAAKWRGAMHDQVHETLGKWAEAFGRGDGPAIAALYTPDALFIGGLGGVHQGLQAIAGYFAANPTRASIVFRDVVVRPQGADAAVVAMIGAITAHGGEPRDFRFLQLHVRTPQGWRIAGHHGSHSL